MSGEREGWRRPAYGLLLTAYLAALSACTVTPLTNKVRVGEEPFVIAVGEGPDSMTDLFAAPAGNGSFARLTFNRAEERLPRLARDGRHVAYLRRPPGENPASWSLVILDLSSNAEQRVTLPPESGTAEALGWSRDGHSVVLRAPGHYYTLSVAAKAGALEPVPIGSTPQADSLTRELLGPGEAGVIKSCGNELCVAIDDSLTPLGAGVTGAIRWGEDSVGYFRAGGFEVRPLGGGYARRPRWSGSPAHLREITYSPGQVTMGSGVSGRR